MKKSVIIIISVLVILIFVILVYFFFPRYYFDRDVRFCMSMQSMQSSCISYIAIERNNSNVCTTFKIWDTKRTDCITFYAKNSGDSKACYKLSSKNIRGEELNDYSINHCMIESLSSNPNPETCKAIFELYYQYQCYYTLATEHGLPYYCGNLIGKAKDPITGEEYDWQAKQQDCQQWASTEYWINQEKNGTK